MKNILITGPPGVGKTTLIKKIVDKLSALQIDFNGFYTEEVKDNNRRIGFDIVTLDGQRAILARKSSQDSSTKMPTVGQYSVHVNDFEKLALPVIEKPSKMVVIDEIGKMESFSRRFQDGVKKTIESKDITVIATIPIKGGPALVQRLREDRDSRIITVSQANRDKLLDEVVNLIVK